MAHYGLQANILNVPKPQEPYSGLGLTALPLNLLALIISYVDDVADLARICRTSRLLHYMTVPQLYKSITLSAYHNIRYKDDVPEGFGNASPFSMGLNALVTRNTSSLVELLALQGEWREHDLDEYSRAGRVPDGSMMLNIAVRAAIDRCVNLKSFKWELNVRILPTVYSGLTQLKNLQSFHLRCPSDRTPQPTTEVPSLPNLREFTLTNYDPLNYPDDVSSLLFNATKLETLNLHFSPRMRDTGEPSVQFTSFFRHNIAAKRPLRLKKVGLYNVIAQHTPEAMHAFDTASLEVVTAINSFGNGVGADVVNNHSGTYFIDRTWELAHKSHKHKPVKLRSCREDRVVKDVIEDIRKTPSLERLYFINARRCHTSNGAPSDTSLSRSNGSTPAQNSAVSGSSRGTPTRSSTHGMELVRDNLVDALSTIQGSNLKHLIIPARIPLSFASTAMLIRGCPNLTQLSLAMEEIEPATIRLIFPFAKNLWAVRFLCPDQPGEEGFERRKRFEAFEAREDHIQFLEMELAARFGGTPSDFERLKIFSLGSKIWASGALVEDMITSVDEDGNELQERVLKRRVRQLELKDVMDIDIWKMDTTDII